MYQSFYGPKVVTTIGATGGSSTTEDTKSIGSTGNLLVVGGGTDGAAAAAVAAPTRSAVVSRTPSRTSTGEPMSPTKPQVRRLF